MSIHKDNATGKWRVVYRYTDWTGETHQSSKRGFPTKREAQMWERELLLKKEAKLDMTFESFYEIYVEDMQNRIRDNTWGTKTNIARTKILPYFGKRKIGEIEPRDIIAWQNELLAIRQPNGKPYSASYLQKIHSQLSAIFNHAVNFYHLPSNPAQKAGNMGKEEHREMLFWTKEEYLKFADVMMDKPVSYYAFEILYWCGLRMGELLALTPADFNFETHTLRINKSYQGTVLYLALEDDYARLQKRLSQMFGMEGSENFYFATKSKSLNDGLEKQLVTFVTEHKDARLIIIDTLQKVREVGGDKFSYASDYEIVTKLKAFSDKYGICFLVVHHTRKMESSDSFDMISGTNGLLGAADGAFVMQKEKRTDNKAVLEVAGRDQQDQKLWLNFNRERCVWELTKTETELWKEPEDPVLEKIKELVTEITPEWAGTATELVEVLQVEMQPNALSRKLNVSLERLILEYGIQYKTERGHDGRKIRLAFVGKQA